MPDRDAQVYLEDILDAIQKIGEYTNGLEYDDFVEDQKTIDAVVRNLEIIGEAANQISGEITKQHPDIPWKKIVSMRNKVIHEYAGVDAGILWKTIEEDLPLLREQIILLRGA